MIWPRPTRILLLTYDRADHAASSYDVGLVGVPKDRGSITKASRVRKDDWVLIRISHISPDKPALTEFKATRPGRVIGKGAEHTSLLWPEEIELQQVRYPFRIPVTFEGGPHTRSGCIDWGALSALRFRGKRGDLLETPQQWGIKFSTNVLEDVREVSAFLQLIERCVTG